MKTLIKHEYKNLCIFIMVFFAGACFVGLDAITQVENFKNSFINNHIYNMHLLSRFSQILEYMQQYIIPLLLFMVYFQFKEIKDSNSSEFILALPFKTKTILAIKIIVGSSILFISSLIILILFIAIKFSAEPLISEVRAVMPEGNIYAQADSIFFIIGMVFTFTLKIVLIYLFLVMSQFLVKKVGVSIIITVLGVLAIPYILFFVYFESEIVSEHIATIITKLILFSYGDDIYRMIANNMNSMYISQIILTNILALVFANLFCITSSFCLIQKVRFTNFKYFTCSKYVDITLKIMTAICCAILPWYLIVVNMIDDIWWIVAPFTAGIGYLIMHQIIKKEIESHK
ncbi:hypothetical protein AN641_09285 [Candidatus Epulonipiscioides gigas]|nr:hypothetical protein AN641_09285 [Epulopiscium sp. SCG-C07WGA-EpuloA2]